MLQLEFATCIGSVTIGVCSKHRQSYNWSLLQVLAVLQLEFASSIGSVSS